MMPWYKSPSKAGARSICIQNSQNGGQSQTGREASKEPAGFIPCTDHLQKMPSNSGFSESDCSFNKNSNAHSHKND
jgi:hypothetical protein